MPGFIIPLDIANDFYTGEQARSDYREVPASDKGNRDYSDQGRLGFYAPQPHEQFTDYGDVKWYTGYGATESDLRLGYVKPDIRQHPAYELSNYKDRLDTPKLPDRDQGNVDVVPSDIQFRQRNRVSNGLFTRPRIPRER